MNERTSQSKESHPDQNQDEKNEQQAAPGSDIDADNVDETARRGFEQAFHAGKQPALDSYLPLKTDSRYVATLEELTHIDMEYGWKFQGHTAKAAQTFVVEQYLNRFPELQERNRLLPLIEQEYRMRHRYGDQPSAESVVARFLKLLTVEQIENWPIRERRRGEAEHRLQPNRRFGNFQLQRQIGRGAMGEVWKAHDTVGDRPVVIKFIPPELRQYTEELERVKQTFKQVHALQHQHICPTYLLDEDADLGMYLVMKYIDGTTLSQYRLHHAAADGRITIEQTIQLLKPVAAALDYAHSHKIVHRDIKPQNIMVSRDGADVQVVDFGLAAEFRSNISRISQQRMESSGTYPYMAPEQWRGQYQNAATDQYALAVMAYEMLAGRLPFEAVDNVILRQCVLEDEILPIESQPVAVNSVLVIAMAKDRTGRYNSCLEFVQAMEHAANSESHVKKFTSDEEDSHREERKGTAAGKATIDLTGFEQVDFGHSKGNERARRFVENTLQQWSTGALDFVSPRYQAEAQSHLSYLGVETFISKYLRIVEIISRCHDFVNDEILVEVFGQTSPGDVHENSRNASVVLSDKALYLIAMEGEKVYCRSLSLENIKSYDVSGWRVKRLTITLRDNDADPHAGNELVLEVEDAPPMEVVEKLCGRSS